MTTRRPELSKLCSEAGLNLIEVGRFFCALPSPENMHYIEKTNGQIVQNGWIRSNEAIRLCLGGKGLPKTIGGCSVEVNVPSLLEDQTISWIIFVRRC